MAVNKKEIKGSNRLFDYFSVDKLFSVSLMPYLDSIVNIVIIVVYIFATLALSYLLPTKSLAVTISSLVYVYLYYRFVWVTLFRLMFGFFVINIIWLILPKRGDNIVKISFCVILVSLLFGYSLAITDPLVTGKEISSGFHIFDSMLPLSFFNGLWAKFLS